MSKSVINKSILHSLRISEKEEANENFIDDDFFDDLYDLDDSFNQLHSLQILIQKHSALKELCNKN